jgi:hypothetical protein
LFLDFWKKNEKNKINFPYCGKNVDEARFDFGLRSRRKQNWRQNWTTKL